MNLINILKKAWLLLWSYKTLWLFGAVLALVTTNMVYPGLWFDQENIDQWTKIKITDTTTIQVPGADMTIDLTRPEGVRITTPDVASWREFRQLVNELNREEAINLWPILIEFAAILVLSILLGMVARYVVETAIILMVNETEETGRRLSFREGLRGGFSSRAGRLFLLDLVVSVVTLLVFIVGFGLAAVPVLLAAGSNETALITAGLGTFGLLVLAAYLWLAAHAVLSLVLQTVRRACVLEEQSLMTSVRQGIMMTKHHLKDLAPLWLVWISIMLVWLPLGALMLIVLTPVLLVSILAGAALGVVPAVLVAIIAGQFTSVATSWVMGALAGLPIFIVVMVSPMLFVSGLVEVYKSTIWTLAYRQLKVVEIPVQTVGSLAESNVFPGTAD